MWHRIDDPDNPPPKDGTVLLLADWRVSGGHIVAVSWDDGDWSDAECMVAYSDEFFTHWHAAPPPPTEDTP